MRTLILFLLCASSVTAQYVRKDGVVQLPSGQAVAGASIAVCSQPASAIVTPCTPQVALYSTSTGLLPGGGTSQLSGNLAISDVNGNYFYYVLSGTYTEQIYGPLIFGSFVRTDQNIGVSLASSVTATNLVGPGTVTGPYSYNGPGTHSGTETFTGPFVVKPDIENHDDTNQNLETRVAGDINHSNLGGEGPSFVAINNGSTGSNTASICARNGTYPGANINGCIHFGFWDGSAWHSYIDFLPAKSAVLGPSRFRMGTLGSMIINPTGAGANLDPDTYYTVSGGLFAVQQPLELGSTARFFNVTKTQITFDQNVPVMATGTCAFGNVSTPISTCDFWAADGGNYFLGRRSPGGNSVINALSDGSGNGKFFVANAAGVAQVTLNAANGSVTGTGSQRAAIQLADQGIACTNGELALSGGWQSTGSATVTAVAGNGQTCSWTITTGTTTAANPTVTDTLTNALPAATTVCELNIHGGTHTAASGEGFQQTTLSATAPIFTFNGTPTSGGTTYFVTRRCGP